MKTVAIVGAGPGGLCAAKECLERGLDPTVFEQASQIGGLWRPDGGSVWESLRTNVSRFNCMLPDLRWDPSTPLHPSQRQVYEYLREYAETFKLYPLIHLNTPVREISQKGTGWKVEVLQEGNPRIQEFDFVIVCSGIFSKAFTPKTNGLEHFVGTSIHSQDYKQPETFKGKKIVVVGNSYSGTDIAAELSSVAKVTHVIRRIYTIFPRLQQDSTGKKLPFDLIDFSSSNDSKETIESEPQVPDFNSISDEYEELVKQGTIQLKKGEIEEIQADRVIFKDGSSAEADVIIWSTGYKIDFPFLEPSTTKLLGLEPDDQFHPLLLHKCVFSSLPNIAFVGAYRGAFWSALALQAQWIAMVFSKELAFPSGEEIRDGIAEERWVRNLNPRPQFPHPDYIEMANMYARIIGCMPDFEELRLNDPQLHDRVANLPLIAPHYRLLGPGSNPSLALQMIKDLREVLKDKVS